MKKSLALIVTFALSASVTHAARYYVSPDGNNFDDGTSWATAKQTLQAAINVAVNAGDEVIVAPGTYAPIVVNDNRTIIIRAAETNDAAVTVIDGGNTNRCATLKRGWGWGDTDTQLQGFTLRNGNASHGNVTVDNGNGGGAYGGTLTDCVLTGNTAAYGGGALGSNLNRCLVKGNTASNWAGGTHSGILNQCIITSNSAVEVGAGACFSTMHNCLITGNTTPGQGGGMHGATLYNCTVTGNSAGWAGGVSGGEAYNTIVSHNTATEIYNNHVDCIFRYSCTTPIPTGQYNGGDNIWQDPMFADAASGNFRLALHSPCINGGENAYAGTTEDLAGNTRVKNGVVDMGAYEHQATSVFYVRPGGSDGYDGSTWALAKQTIQGAVGAAVNGDVIIVTNGSYTAITTSGMTIGIRSVNGPTVTDIDGNHASRCATLAITYSSYYITNTVLAGFTLKNGKAFSVNDEYYDGSGGASFGGTLYGCILTNNTATFSGGGAHYSTLHDCTIVDNTATGISSQYSTGGGAANSMLYNCTIRGNMADDGGGVSGGIGHTVSNCWIVANTANRGGGGSSGCDLYDCMINGNTATGTSVGYNAVGGGANGGYLYNCTISGNKALGISANGGGTYNAQLYGCTLNSNEALGDYSTGGGAYVGYLYDCTLSWNKAYQGGGAYGGTLYDCTFANNSATTDGGGAHSGLLYDCTLTNNTAISGGGTYNGTLNRCVLWANKATGVTSGDGGGGAYYGMLNNCLLTGNTTARYGGGAYHGTLNNCTIVNNTADWGAGGVFGASDYGSATVNNCIVWGNKDTVGTPDNYAGSVTFNHSCIENRPPSGNNINTNPQFINAGAGNYRLTAGASPCINAGNNALVPLPQYPAVEPLVDLDGNARIAGGTVDMGAYEANSLPVMNVTLNWNGGSGFMSSLICTNTYAGLPISGTPPSYHTFNGWTNSAGTVVTGGTTFLAADYATTLYARWTRNAPDAPSVYATSAYADRITVSWVSVSDATEYKVFRSTVNNSAVATHIATVPAYGYVDDFTAAANVTYYYWVKAVNGGGESAFSAPAQGIRPLSATAWINASQNQPDKITVSWSGVSGATGYRLYRSTDSSSASATLIATFGSSAYTFDDTAALPGTTYYYWLKTLNADEVSAFNATPAQGLRPITILQNAVPVNNLYDYQQYGWQNFKIAVPAGATSLTIVMSGGTGDADLYVKHGAVPTLSVYDYRPYQSGNNETVTVTNPTAGDWYISLHAYEAYNGVTLVATWTTSSPQTETSHPVPYTWLDTYYSGLVTPQNYEDKADSIGANGHKVWESYIAGLIPTNAASKFAITNFVVNAQGKVTKLEWSPNYEVIPEPVSGKLRVYTVYGKTNLTDITPWYTPTNSATRFFRVEVKMPNGF